MSCYERIWRRIGGRPWTYIIRDWWRDYELLWVIGLVAAGALLCNWQGIAVVVYFLSVFALGTLFGHLFWPDGIVRKEENK